MNSARKFGVDLERFGSGMEAKGDLILRKIVLDLMSAVVMDTPVDTGRARGNWYPSINVPSDAKDDSTVDPSGGGVVANIMGTASRANMGDAVWLSNNLPYILRLENGSSKQSPQGMVDKNIEAAALRYGGVVAR